MASSDSHLGAVHPETLDPACAERRDEILNVAAGIFAERGYHGTDVQAVADAAGVGKGTIYRYLVDKRGLFLAVADRVMRGLRDHILSSLPQEGRSIDKIVAGTRAYLGYFQRHPEHIEILIIERAVFRDTIKPTHFVYREASIGILQDLMRQAVKEGDLRSLDPVAVADALDSLCYGTVVVNALAHRTKDLAMRADTIIQMFLDGYRQR